MNTVANANIRKHERRIIDIEQRLGADIRTLYIRMHEVDGMTCAEIAAAIGVPARTLRRWRRWYGIPVLKHGIVPLRSIDIPRSLENKARALGYGSLAAYNAEMHKRGITMHEREKILGCGNGAIYRALRAQGIEPLPPLRTEKQTQVRRETMQRLNAEGGRGRGFGKL